LVNPRSGTISTITDKIVFFALLVYEWRPETEDRRRKTGDGRPETEDRRPETGDGRPETGDRRRKTGVRSQE